VCGCASCLQEEFTPLRGALATVDRSYGILDHVLHHITDTHVMHHLFHTMPFYHAREATAAVQKVLGPYYLRDTTPIARALFQSWSKCKYVDDVGSYVFYKS
jgi:omega-6 fatty acid desaturase (delta-12 desaturase)